MKSKIQNKIGKAFNKKLADAVREIKLFKVMKNPTLAQRRAGLERNEYLTRGVIYDPPRIAGGQRDSDSSQGGIYSHDRMAIILQNELLDDEKNQVIPAMDDELESDGKTWKVRKASNDPADAIWELKLESMHVSTNPA